MCRGDSLRLQSAMSFFAPQIQFSAETTEERLYFSNLDLELGRSNRRKGKGTFCAYSTMCPVVHHIEKYSSEKLFDENDMTFLNATRK